MLASAVDGRVVLLEWDLTAKSRIGNEKFVNPCARCTFSNTAPGPKALGLDSKCMAVGDMQHMTCLLTQEN